MTATNNKNVNANALANKAQIPIVHKSSAVDGILTKRQKGWVEGASNDIYTENPVIYRHCRHQKEKEQDVFASKKQRKNINGLLSENLDEQRSYGGIIEKIQEIRKDRHESTIEDMMQELATISLDLESQVQDLSNTAKEYLDKDSKEIQQVLAGIMNDTQLVQYSMKDIRKIWISVEKHSAKQEGWINELAQAFNKIEENRSVFINDVIMSYTMTLERIAHLMPPDVHRLMEDEAAKINYSMISNKSSYADLIKRLLTADVERERKLFTQWKNRVADWKTLKLEEALRKHREYMRSGPVVNSPAIKRILDDLIQKQITLNGRRLDLLNQLMEMKPPSSTKASVFQWNQAITESTEELEQVHTQSISLVKLEHERVLSECDEYMKNSLDDLFHAEVVEENVLEEMSHESFLPLIGERKATFDYDMERLQEMLDKNRKEHDYQNQIKEAKLDIVMDRMRQESTEDALASSLKQALAMLSDIMKGYFEFHSLQKQTCEKYPHMIYDEVQRYGISVCGYFNVSKRQKQKDVKTIVKTEAITLSNGSLYHLLRKDFNPPNTAESDETTHTLLTTLDDDDATATGSNTIVIPYVESFFIPEDLFKKLKYNMCREFLEHLEKWKEEAVTRAEAVVVIKMEEIDNELDLRLYLHEPRSKRAENDVHDVRAEELVLHRDRVEQHCLGISETLSSLKIGYQDMLRDHVHENETFKRSVEELVVTFNNATNTNELKAMQDQVNGKLDQYVEIIRASVRHFHFNLDDTLNKLRNSNAQFRKALKIFSEGGNFSPEEVEEFRKRLEKMATKINNCEGSLIGQLEGMETKRLDIAKEFARKLEDRFKHHLFDLTFVEKIKRWLTNIQVKIKGEVANSNSQSQHLSKMISVFSRRLERIKNPSVDGEKFTVEELHETLQPVIGTFISRTVYLDCAFKVQRAPSTPVILEGSSKQDIEKCNLKGKGRKSVKKQASRLKRLSSGKSTHNSNEKTTASLVGKKDSAEEEGLNVLSDVPTLLIYGHQNSTVRTQYGARYDKKYLVFGENDPEVEPENNFLALQLRLLQTGLDGMLSTSELYYRHKGQRQLTRQQLINETFDGCAESLIERLKRYKEQTDAFYNSSIQEFRAQIRRFSQNIEQLPLLLTSSMANKYVERLNKFRNEITTALKRKKEQTDKNKRNHQTLLRPTLGHPNNKNELAKLREMELSRQVEADTMLKNYEQLMMEYGRLNLTTFLTELQDMVLILMSQFDSVVTLDDVVEGALQIKPISEKRLLKEKMSTKNTINNEVNACSTSSTYTWPGLDLSQYNVDKDTIEDCNNTLTPVISIKKTDAHEAAVHARDTSFKEYYEHSAKSITAINAECKKLRFDEERWKINWETSLQKITELY
ncbi:coiled-coil domain-containing protein 180-like isoform X2 [Hydractinia symbiolongicarpus]|uniref:coiled-coil domain-containing protein 180-like isoform X2 n=1 Tax=Hydractinia symbiolongicarpus TaxID=13093 RepID=UPI00254EF3BB|nr:coiled-coil domain-containing protein 180-like isoform X2 [Hydractinia symbiolongicarpus]